MSSCFHLPLKDALTSCLRHFSSQSCSLLWSIQFCPFAVNEVQEQYLLVVRGIQRDAVNKHLPECLAHGKHLANVTTTAWESKVQWLERVIFLVTHMMTAKPGVKGIHMLAPPSSFSFWYSDLPPSIGLQCWLCSLPLTERPSLPGLLCLTPVADESYGPPCTQLHPVLELICVLLYPLDNF